MGANRRMSSARSSTNEDPYAEGTVEHDIRVLVAGATVDVRIALVYVEAQVIERHYDQRSTAHRAVVRRALETAASSSHPFELVAFYGVGLALLFGGAAPSLVAEMERLGGGLVAMFVTFVLVMVGLAFLTRLWWGAHRKAVRDHGLSLLLAEREAQLAARRPPPRWRFVRRASR